MAIKIGGTYTFRYPEHFTTEPEYTAHAGQTVRVTRAMKPGRDYDYEGDRMYDIQAADGWTGEAWETELEAIA